MFRERKALAQAAPFCVHQGFPEWAFTHQQQGMSSTAQASKSAHLIPKEKPPFRLAGNAITHNLLQSKWIAAPTSYAGLQESKGPKSECVHTLNQDVCHPLAPACTILFLTIAILLPVALLPGGGGGARRGIGERICRSNLIQLAKGATADGTERGKGLAFLACTEGGGSVMSRLPLKHLPGAS